MAADDPEADIADALGVVTYNWTLIEAEVYNLCLALLITLDRDFRAEHVIVPCNVMLATMDLRQRIAVAKVLAHRVKNTSSFYPRLSEHLKHIDTKLRMLRNRYIHDEWIAENGEFSRIQYDPTVKSAGPKGPNPDAVFMRIAHVQTFTSTDELSKLGNSLKEALNLLREFVAELQTISQTLDKLPISETRVEWHGS